MNIGGANCIKCGLSMSSWTTVNGNPCCDWCHPDFMKIKLDVEEQRARIECLNAQTTLATKQRMKMDLEDME